MKFKCGLTKEEKEAKRKKRKRSLDELRQWHGWFAWYPVTVGDADCRWLEIVWRRLVPSKSLCFGEGYVYHEDGWEYASQPPQHKENK